MRIYKTIKMNQSTQTEKELILNLTNMIPPTIYYQRVSDLTPDSWKTLLPLLRLTTEETADDTLKYAKGPTVLNQSWKLGGNDYDTEDSRYRNYINSVLSALNRGEKDYCYYVYQVRELLRFHPDLKARLVIKEAFQYIEVSLPKKRGESNKKHTVSTY